MNNKNSELDRTIEEVRRELRTILIRRQELILKLGWAFEKVVANKESICEEIKNCLREEIALGIISPRTIEQSCPHEWKKKTKPKLENEKFSFSHPKPEQKQRTKIVMDNHGNRVQETESDNGDSNPEVGSRQDAREIAQQDNELLQRQQNIIRELINENRRLKQEKGEVQVMLGEAIESLHIQKQREAELLRKIESTANRTEQYQNVIEIEFPVNYRPLQNHMAEIYKSPTRQEVWFAVKIDVNKKKVVSVQLGRKLLPQNVVETRDGNGQR
jgi:hypothetical protein